jgi:hypothetical protein
MWHRESIACYLNSHSFLSILISCTVLSVRAFFSNDSSVWFFDQFNNWICFLGYMFLAHERLIRINSEFQLTQDDAPQTAFGKREEVFELLDLYYDTKVPTPGDVLYLHLPYEHKHITFQCPVCKLSLLCCPSCPRISNRFLFGSGRRYDCCIINKMVFDQYFL